MKTPLLTQAQQRRLLRLAQEAGRTPQAMLRFVLQDGFDYCEYVVRSVNEGIGDLRQGATTYSTAEVMDSARAALDHLGRHGTRARKAA